MDYPNTLCALGEEKASYRFPLLVDCIFGDIIELHVLHVCFSLFY